MAKVNMMQLQEDPPRVGNRMLTGYGVDGVPIYATVELEPGLEVCRQCEGTGRYEYVEACNGFERHRSMQCQHCDGDGVVASGDEQ